MVRQETDIEIAQASEYCEYWRRGSVGGIQGIEQLDHTGRRAKKLRSRAIAAEAAGALPTISASFRRVAGRGGAASLQGTPFTREDHMNTADLIDRLVTDHSITTADAKKYVETDFGAITDRLPRTRKFR